MQDEKLIGDWRAARLVWISADCLIFGQEGFSFGNQRLRLELMALLTILSTKNVRKCKGELPFSC
jgi:hypothetical protein